MNIRGLYAIVDNTRVPQIPHRELARRLLVGGAKILQFRMKKGRGILDSDLLGIAAEIQGLKKDHEFCFIVNDNLAVAKEVGADGYHGGVDDPDPEEAREVLGPEALIGYSAHSLEEAVEAERRGADYVAYGAIFPSRSKGVGHPVQGIERLREVVTSVGVPVVAIGGIGRNNLEEVLSTGASATAMISALVEATDIVNETHSFCVRIKGFIEAFRRKGPLKSE